MSRWTMQFLLALGVIAFLAVPVSSYAGEKIKEHECVGKDTALDLADDPPRRDNLNNSEGEDAHCTPLRSEILPPGGDSYGPEDMDESVKEEFVMTGALEVLDPDAPRGSNQWETIPTIKEPGFRQAGFRATASYTMLIKAGAVVSPLEVACGVCAARPQGLGPAQTFVPYHKIDDAVVTGTSEFIDRLNIKQQPWLLEARHICSPANPWNGPGCGGQLTAKTIPGLEDTLDGDVTFLACKPTTVLLHNTGRIFQGDYVEVRITVPESARASGTFDVTSCELSYLRPCLPGEKQFDNKKNICRG